MKKWLIHQILNYPKVILLSMIGLTMLFASFLEKPGLKFDNSTENIFPEHNPEVNYFHKFRKKFGSDEFIAVTLYPKEQKTVFTPTFLAYVKRLTHQFQKVRYVENVLSITSMKKPQIQQLNTKNLPAKKILPLILKKLTAPQREKLIRSIFLEQIRKKKPLPLSPNQALSVILSKITVEERDDLIREVVADTLGNSPLALSEKQTSKLLKESLKGNARSEVFTKIAIAHFKGKPLTKLQMFELVYSHLSSNERDELIKKILKTSLSPAERQVSQPIIFLLPPATRHQLFREIGRAQLGSQKFSKADVFRMAFAKLTSKMKEKLLGQMQNNFLKEDQFASLFQKEKVLKSLFDHLSPQSRESILREIVANYIPEEALKPDKEALFKSVFLHIPPKKREAILKDIILHYMGPGDFKVDILDFFQHYDFQAPLEKIQGRHIPPKLRRAFQKHKIHLPAKMALRNRGRGEWTFLLQGKKYLIRTGQKKFSVYYESLPPTWEEVEQVKELLLKIPPARGTILPRKGLDKTAIVLQVQQPPKDPEKELAKIVKEVRSILVKTKTLGLGEIEYHIAGAPAVKADIMRAIKVDVATFVPITVLIIILIIFYLFRTVGAVTLPLLVIFVTDIWILGLMSFLGYALNSLTSLIISLMFVIGVADVVHLMAKYFDEMEKTGVKTLALEHMLDQLLLPCWITSFTTIIGFASLMISDVEPIRHFGLFASIGTLLAFILSILLVCPCFQLFGIHREKTSATEEKEISGGLRILFRLSLHQGLMIGIAILVLVVSAIGIFKMNVETNFIEFFKEKSRVRRANSFVEDNFAGIAPLEIVFAPKKGSLQDYEVLKRMDRFQQFLTGDPFLKKYIDQATSILDFYKFSHMIKLPDIENLLKPKNLKITSSLLDGKRYTLPATAEAYKRDYQLFQKITNLYDQKGRGVRKFLAYSFNGMGSSEKKIWKVARISVRMKAVSSKKAAKVIQYIRDHIEKEYPKDKIHVTGTAALFAEAANSIVESQKSSFLIAIVIIFFTMIVVFRSLIVGLLGLIPNILPIATTFGAMGWLGIPLNSSTSMVASISIGIAVDVAVHFISRFQLEHEKHRDILRALLETFQKTGKPILFTSSILMAGFLVLCLASFVPTIQFGILTCITIFSALLSGLVVLPAVMFLVYRKKKNSPEPGEKE